jgi:Response receiver domain
MSGPADHPASRQSAARSELSEVGERASRLIQPEASASEALSDGVPTLEQTFRQLCRNIAAHFMQTAVVVDDEARYAEPATAPGLLKIPDSAARLQAAENLEAEYIDAATAHSIAAVPDTEVPLIETETSEVDAKQLVDAFARLQLVCAVIKPAPDEEFLLNELLAIARRSDLLILDWNLDGDLGITTREVIREVIMKDQELGGRLRLICVYTGRQDLGTVQEQLANDLREFGLQKDPADGRFRLGDDACRIVILAKPNISLPEPDQISVVPLHLLPDRLLDEFTELAAGLLPTLALESLAALRDNAHHLLRRFHAGLDAPFLSQRALAEDPEIFAVSLVASEMQAVLEETEVRLVLSKESVRAWAHDHFAQAIPPSLKRRTGSEAVHPDWVKEFLSAPRNAAEAPYAPDGQRLGSINLAKARSVAELFTRPDQDPIGLEHEFARLSSLSRSISHQFVGAEPPLLRLGTLMTVVSGPQINIPSRTSKRLRKVLEQQIDARPAVGSYWLSLQPDCDSVRLNEARKFPMVPLTEIEASEALSGGKDFDLVALSPDGKPLYFRTGAHPYELRMVLFAPNGSVIRATHGIPGPIFTDMDGMQWRWIAQLRYAHALRLASSLGRAMGRVGLDESEWLRRHGRSSD